MKIFEKSSIGDVSLKNHFVRSAVWMNMATKEGHLTPKLIDIFEDLAKGDIGLIHTGYAFIDPLDKAAPNMAGFYDNSFIQEHQELTQRVHQYGSAISLQIAYGGLAARKYNDSITIKGPSDGVNPKNNEKYEALSEEDILRIKSHFVQAAVRAQKANYDGIQLHVAHGYLLSQFLSPEFNQRDDQYGGSIHNRAKIIYSIVEEIRSAVSPHFLVGIKINCQDDLPQGKSVTTDEITEVIEHLETRGLDYAEISGGSIFSTPEELPSRIKIHKKPEKQSYYLKNALKISQKISIPVILVGGNRDLCRINSIIEDTPIEFISMARPFISEPNLIQLWKENRNYSPKCISCNKCFYGKEGIQCIFN